MDIRKNIEEYGCNDVVVLGEEPTSRHLEYLDLLGESDRQRPVVDAVAEFQSRPLLYIVSEGRARNVDSGAILELQQALANRGERAYLAFLAPGELNVYPVNLARKVLEQGEHRTVRYNDPNAGQFFQSVATGTFSLQGQPATADFVFRAIHDLMSESSKRLIGAYQLHPLDVLSMLGRALFFRFLWDRHIVLENELPDICPGANGPGDCFSGVSSTVATCSWLDRTFNGDLLPFSDACQSVFRQAEARSNGEVFLHLQAIIEGWEHRGNGHFQPQFPIDWADLDFSHIPIGVLSQVYEDFSRVWDQRKAEANSVYYTPKNIARYLVDDAFEGISDKCHARILDPSCGAGIFLILAFRKLVAARWEADGRRPDTQVIQDILYDQICGFDVSESALRLAALSLYVTAIELNDSPRPPASLKFPAPLRNCVLFNHRRENEADADHFVLGSLRPDLSTNFDGQFDLVIGNPPWSRIRSTDKDADKKLNERFTEIAKTALINRDLKDLAKTYTNPDTDPDLPFLWAATRWAKPQAIIAMALPARIFLKQTPGGKKALQATLKGIEVTGILNGSNLSDTEVWPKMNQPFMLLFARNAVPDEDHHFHFATPDFEPQLNGRGRIRIDYRSAQPVSCRKLSMQPSLLKTLAIGTVLDVGVLEKLSGLNWATVKKYWDENGLESGLGYNRSPDNKQQASAEFMIEMQLMDFVPPASPPFLPGPDFFQTLELNGSPGEHTLHMPRRKGLYQSPLLIVPEAPGQPGETAKSWVTENAVAFRKSYYGFSASGSKMEQETVRLLHLLTHSKLLTYHLLMTSSRMGAERRTFLKADLESFPFPDTARLPLPQQARIRELSQRLENAQHKPWSEINEFIFDLYGLNEYDRQVVTDTLEVCSPFSESRQRASCPPTCQERKTFYAHLERLVAPSFDVTGEMVVVEELSASATFQPCPWHFFAVSTERASQCGRTQIGALIREATREADRTGASRVIIHGEGVLFAGVLAQYRYWTPSRARLCALDILHNHMDAFPVEGN